MQRDAEAEAKKARIEEARRAALKRWRNDLPNNVELLEVFSERDRSNSGTNMSAERTANDD